MLTIEVIRIHDQHLDEAGLAEVEVQAASKAGDERGGVFEETKLSSFTIRNRLIGLVLGATNDAIEFNPAEKVLI